VFAEVSARGRLAGRDGLAQRGRPAAQDELLGGGEFVEVTLSGNAANAGPFSHNTTGYRGVIRYRKGWRAQIKHRGRPMVSCTLSDKRQAAILRDEMAGQLFKTTVYLNLPDVVPDAATVAEASRLIQRTYGA
jgi:hypothetical protein